ncbi:MAG: hypothetical protein ABI547_02210 [Betaproteobacteria bacterium]
MHKRSIFAALLVAAGNAAGADALQARDASRGELLYSTHCVGCHGAQVHWREKKLVTDWASLQAQVNRWETVSGLKWGNEDVAEVSRYLNTVYYRYPTPN